MRFPVRVAGRAVDGHHAIRWEAEFDVEVRSPCVGFARGAFACACGPAVDSASGDVGEQWCRIQASEWAGAAGVFCATLREPGIEAQAKAMVTSGLARVGYEYVNVDSGWYSCPGPQGPTVDRYGRWDIDAQQLPGHGSVSGIKAVADYVHHLGLKFGLYVTPGLSEQAVARNTVIKGTRHHADDIATSIAEYNYDCGGMVESTTPSGEPRRSSTPGPTSSRHGASTTSSWTGSGASTSPMCRRGPMP